MDQIHPTYWWQLIGGGASILFTIALDVVSGEVCQRQRASSASSSVVDALQNIEVFQCPRLFESKKKSWCCSSNTVESDCCEWEQRAREAGLDPDGPGAVSPWALKALLALFALAFAITAAVLCYICHKGKSHLCAQHSSHRHGPRPLCELPQANAPELTQIEDAFRFAPVAIPVPQYSHYPDEPPSYEQAISLQCSARPPLDGASVGARPQVDHTLTTPLLGPQNTCHERAEMQHKDQSDEMKPRDDNDHVQLTHINTDPARWSEQLTDKATRGDRAHEPH